MNKKVSIVILSLALMGYANAANDAANYADLTGYLSSSTTGANPINQTANITFTGPIAINTNSYLINTGFVLDGGTTYTATNSVDTEGVQGFNITPVSPSVSINNIFNNFTMQNFYTHDSGGAIFNNGSNVLINNGTFTNNYALDNIVFASVNYGGAISNRGGYMIINDSAFNSNMSSGAGAVVNNDLMDISNTSFNNNIAQSDHFALGTEGGAFANYMTANIYNSSFTNNTAKIGTLEAYGGAIFNAFTGVLSIENTLFDGNESENYGGAIYNDVDGVLNIKNSIFQNNAAADLGGAIHNESELNIYAIDGNTIFINNTANGADNAIYNNDELNLLANNGEIIFNDAIVGTNSSVINIGDASHNGTVQINSDMTGVLGTTTLQNGTVMFGQSGTMFGGGLTVDTISGGRSIIDLQNSALTSLDASNLILNTDAYIAIDVNLATGLSDEITNVSGMSGTGDLIISNINLLDTSTDNQIVAQITTAPDNRLQLDSTLTTVSSGLYNYGIDGTKLSSDGTLSFTPIGISDYTTTSLSAQSAHTVLLADVSEHVLTPNYNDMFQMGLPADVNLYGNKASVWVDAYGSKSDINHDGYTIDSSHYLSIAGVDIPLYKAGCLRSLMSVYGGYIGSTQEYNDINIHQNGYIAGMGLRLENRRFFSSITSNFSTSYVNADTSVGRDEFKIYATSIATKNGLNFDFFNDTMFVQPNVLAGYSYIHTNEYVNSANINISSDNIHLFNIAPELKLGFKIGNGYKPYIATSYNWNYQTDNKTTANNLLLPSLALEDYTEFKAGINKSTSNGLSWFAETNATVGDKRGFGGQVGIQWNF